MHRRSLMAGAAALPMFQILPGRAQGNISDGVVKIGILNDMTGVFSDQQGMGEVVAARLAIEDFGPRVLGAPIELTHGDLLNRPDVGMAIARRWYDQERVDAIFGLGNSAVALAVQGLSRERQRVNLSISAGTTDLTGAQCSPFGIHWVYDNYSAAKGPVTALMQQDRKRWYLIVSDFAFGHSLEANAREILGSLGGTVVGAVRAPLGETDYSSYLVRAAASGAQVVGICAGGADAINIAKQMGEFGLFRRHHARRVELVADLGALGGFGDRAGHRLCGELLLGPDAGDAGVFRPLRAAAWAAADILPGEFLWRGDALPQGGTGGGDGCGTGRDGQDARAADQ